MAYTMFPVLVIILLTCSDFILLSSSIDLKKLITPENEQIVKIIKEELDQFRIDMTKSFMKAHSRRRRALAGHVNDIDIKTDGTIAEFSIESVGPFSTFTFAGKPFLIKRDGIYQMNGLTATVERNNGFTEDSLVKRGSWTLQKNEIVLNGFEWKRNFFLVTTTGNFSTIYTLHENSLHPVFRQNIHNKANAVDAEFFDYRRNLYMVIVNDNEMHTTTFSPIFRWAGSYMDEIHQVQTTGASSVKTFLINSKEYIAIAQSKDSTGNTQVGTMVLSMDHLDRLERVQLLWSNGARKVHYMHTDKEHFLVIGQEKEPSIVYWYGGMDFIFWQQFDTLQGKDLAMEGLQLTSDEPIILTSDGDSLRIFSRSASATKIMTTWIESKTMDNLGLQSKSMITSDKSENKITQLKILQFGEANDNVFLVITRKVQGSPFESVQMYPVQHIKRQLSVSRTKEPGDSLSQCLESLRTSLKSSEDNLKRIDELSAKVLTTDGNWDFQGEIVSTKVTKPVSSKVDSAEVLPATERAGSSGLKLENKSVSTSPSKIMEDIKQNTVRLRAMKGDLHGVFFKSKPNAVTGDLTFLKNVKFDKIDAQEHADLQFETINGISWTDLDNFALKTKASEPQNVSAQWTVASFTAQSLETVQKDSKLSSNNFMLTSCKESQSVSGIHQFNKGLTINEVKVEPQTSINGIQFSDIVMKENSAREITGFKHAPFIKGSYSTDFVNNVNLDEWFAGVARLSSPTEQHFTGPVEMTKNANVEIDSLVAEEINGKNWNDFKRTVMLDAVDQELEGSYNADALIVNNLKSESISGVKIDELLTSKQNQHITSEFTAENIEITGPLSTGTINGIKLADAVNRNEKQVEINGMAVLENFKVQDVVVPEGVMIAEKDVSELAALKKVHKYSTVDNSPIFLKRVTVNRISTEHIDNENVDDFMTKYWSKSGNNVANPAQLVLDDRKVVVTEGNFLTGKLNHFSFPDEFVSLDQNNIELRAPLKFKQPVKIDGDVTMTDGATIQGIDMSKAQSMIVDNNFKDIVRGVKTFSLPVTATHGGHIDVLNGIDPRKDVVMLNSDEVQHIDGILTFTKDVKADQFTVENGDMSVDGLVNNMNLEDVKQTTAYKDKPNEIEGELIFQRGINANKFSTMLLNGMNIKDITDNMVFLDSPEAQTIEGLITLKNGGAEFLMDSTVGRINGIPLSQHLAQVIRLDSPEARVIRGTKTFLNASLMDKLMCNTFNNVDLQDLSKNAFSKSKAQEVTGKWSLHDANFNENLHTTEIEGISPDNIVFTDEPAKILSPVAFTSDQTRIQGPLTVTGSLNGIAFDESIKDEIAIDGITKFDQIIVNRDLSWSNDRQELEGLSYFLENAVTKSGSQTITGSVTFTKGLESSEIQTGENWLGDVNLQQIHDDAVMTDAENVVISGPNAFMKPLKIESLVNPVKNLDTNLVNDMDLKSMSDDIVQTRDFSDGRLITGRKLLQSDVHVEHLNVQDKLSDISVSDLVLANNEIEIDEVHFKNLDIEEDIEFVSTQGLDLQALMNDRVSMSNPNQLLEGEYSFEQVNVESPSNCKVPMINDIALASVMKKSDLNKFHEISGKKTFKNLNIVGKMETQSLNNHPINELMDSTLRLDQVEKITRPVIFDAPVIVNQELEVESINGIHLEGFSNQVSERISRLVSDAESPALLSNELSAQASKLQRIMEERPVWFEYMSMKYDLTELGLESQSRVEHVQMSNSGDVLVTLHRETDGQEKGLPKGCNCNSIFTVNLAEVAARKSSAKKVTSIGTDNCLKVFNVVSPNKRSYIVMSETISSNTTCMTEQDKSTQIFRENDELSNTVMGHISDVGVFSENDVDFLVLAQYFDKVTKSHSTVTRVMRVDETGKVENVQNIDTHGAKKVALSKVNDKWMLAIANSKNANDETSCNADSAIYMWSSEINQFLLMRTIMTDGAFDVEFITTETNNEFYKQSFVAFAQEGNSASGEVLIFRYEQLGGNFVMSQTIRTNWPVKSLRTMCICRQCYLVTTVPQDGITFYENRFVEGFQEYYKAPVFGAMDITGFKVDDQYLFAIATNKGPIIAEAVLAGSCPH